MQSISVVVITHNEQDNIGRCLDSVQQVADEIIVLDSFSTDKTVEIARSKAAIVKRAHFYGYIQQKNAANALASSDYILSLDADEALDENLIKSLLAIKKDLSASAAYSFNRCTNYCGKYIRRGSWYPDRKIRLFNRRVARWGGTSPHETLEITGANTNVQHLSGDILHFSFPTVDAHMEKTAKYTTMAAEHLYAKGKKSSRLKILLNPFWAFVQGYFIRGGFLDGFYGFVIAINNAHSTFLKYSKLHQLQLGDPVKMPAKPADAIHMKPNITLTASER